MDTANLPLDLGYYKKATANIAPVVWVMVFTSPG